jgi:hypothetical protein
VKWITRSHVHVDRVACPWLITRFIDSEAEFIFVPKKKVLEMAEKTGAIAFDTPGADLHHRDDLCTFEMIIKAYGLTDRALLRMARIINRLLKKAHLRRWPHPLSFRRRFNYASFQGISAALSLDHFEQPVENEFFRKLLMLPTRIDRKPIPWQPAWRPLP